LLNLERVWRLAQLWYHNRLSPEYHGRGRAEIEAIFQAAGLTAGFWYTDRPSDTKP
jgi:hypothetical protein